MASFSRAYLNMTMSTCLIFPPKTARDPLHWYGSLLLNHTFCVVPRWKWTKLRGLTLSLSDFLSVLCGRILPDCFRAPDTSWKTTLKAIGVKPTSTSNFLSNSSWGTRQSRWCPNSVINLVNFLRQLFDIVTCPWSSLRTKCHVNLFLYDDDDDTVWILRKRVQILDIPDYHPLWRLRPAWPWVFNDIPTKFQCCSYLIGRAPRMNTLTHLWGSSGKHSDGSGVTSKLKLL